MPRLSRARGLALCGALALAWLAPPATADGCPATGQWYLDGGDPVSPDTLMAELAEREVVLLGEQHDRLAHHRWQLHTLAGLYAHRPRLVIGLEMLPREAQPALDAWVAGKLDEAGFLEASQWHDAWGFDPALYFPILHFARMQRIPLLALNVDHALRRRLVDEGWDAVPDAQRFGITPPAAPPEAYREFLAEEYERHPGDDDNGLDRFIDAQLVWDRAMATALAVAGGGDTLVVGLIGQGHLTHGHGVPHQLDDLGLGDHRTLLPVTPDADCRPVEPGLADAYYLLGDESPHEPPATLRLGVLIGEHAEGVAIHGVGPDSVAAEAGLREGDVIVRAAGRPMSAPGDLTRLIQRMVTGTLLPLEVRRDGRVQELLARFPPPSP
ncbi:ChaN family lipoprotein [Halomonas sp. EGI 63088]|uniref:ChaN family lipoprotein n=1 Tax=Halomonas flagellata TaxID=2920385 RepID=A0ABS9RPA5_9GAMM|nr:ChaN family lipoprotein [Halomonas flagellata]MCH4561811.1 ChaN family lipoprotein [Halomonas flagellata]